MQLLETEEAGDSNHGHMCQVPGSLPGASWSVLLIAQWCHYCRYSQFTAEEADTDKVKECDPGPAACDGGGSR